MASDPMLRQEMIALLGRIVGPGPLPDDLRRQAMQMFASLLQDPVATPATAANTSVFGATPANVAGGAALAVPAVTGNRRLVYVHGICQHGKQFSDSWWQSLQPFVPTAFGEGVLGQTRLEVIWSQIVNQVASMRAATLAAPSSGLPTEERERREAAEEIKETLRDRADQQVLAASPPVATATDRSLGAAPLAAADTAGFISIPGANCVDDFSTYLINDGIRQQIIDCFTGVVRPLLLAGFELDVLGHSWGTVVAYEGLRQLEDEGIQSPLVRNFFTVGAALSIGPVKKRLRLSNRDGRKPANVRRWINLDAKGDIVGGPLKGRPYAVDSDLVNLEPVGCGSVFGLVNPQCSHSSYFQAANLAVNRDILAAHIN